MTELTDLLQNLAAELGTTVEYLWGVLIVQAKVSAITNIGFVVFTIVLTLILYRVHLYFSKRKKWDDSAYIESSYGHHDEIIVVPMVIMTILIFILLIASIVMISDIVTALVNPEYWALEQVLKLI